ncbi:ABC transporter ATP-binding protein [Cupriavidus pampae]|uniref:High-affinity branched-chain amino acid transport ATP-binding protein LivF n=1 Tax=Cupriavidus pampae TaxID=659251 RepID=A0ABN7Y162_9BURK|nr:ABC transporter ATP-binding protein [Cupriavidus pampae]CAG9167075.1 High-affinity branched-chain amino acid transport ATP-binding protein LivF [Cupriavidus pampae]
MSAPLILQGVTAGYHGKAIVHNVSLEVPAGGALTVIGPNGSGKSTLLKSVVGLVSLMAGGMRLGEREIGRLDAPARTRLGLAYVPQERNVFPNLSVADNLRLGWETLHGRGGARESARRDEVLALFPEIADRLATPAGLLSGGQRQMAAMASALMQGPSLLVLDEPSAGLSPRNASLLFDRIADIRATGITLLMIEQNVQLGLRVADHGVVLVNGEIRLRASADHLVHHADLPALFFGHAPALSS